MHIFTSLCTSYTCTCAECREFESHPRQLIFLQKSNCLGCAVLLCFVVSMALLASFFLPSESLVNMSNNIRVYTRMLCSSLPPDPPLSRPKSHIVCGGVSSRDVCLRCSELLEYRYIYIITVIFIHYHCNFYLSFLLYLQETSDGVDHIVVGAPGTYTWRGILYMYM